MQNEKDPIQRFRQPLVTAIALILGFSIGFLADWVTEEDLVIRDKSDVILLIGMIVSSIFLIASLLRILKLDYPKEEVLKYYNHTLLLFTVGLVCLFFFLILSFLI